jgi:membrane associated rhomboid family serine protease
VTARPITLEKIPFATICVLAVTGCVTASQFASPLVLPALERVPGGVAAGQWWRLFTPLLVHDGGWTQILFNFTAIALVGAFVERLFGPRNWLLLYFTAGVIGQLAGMRWQPTGAGASGWMRFARSPRGVVDPRQHHRWWALRGITDSYWLSGAYFLSRFAWSTDSCGRDSCSRFIGEWKD